MYSRVAGESRVPAGPAVSWARRDRPDHVTRGFGGGIGHVDHGVALIGRSVVIKGELNGSEDLTIEGQVDGKVELLEHTLTIGADGRVKAQVFAKSVIVLGELVGNINAGERVEIRENGAVDGDIVAPRVAIAEGAHFRGSIDMQRKAPAESVAPAIGTFQDLRKPVATGPAGACTGV